MKHLKIYLQSDTGICVHWQAFPEIRSQLHLLLTELLLCPAYLPAWRSKGNTQHPEIWKKSDLQNYISDRSKKMKEKVKRKCLTPAIILSSSYHTPFSPETLILIITHPQTKQLIFYSWEDSSHTAHLWQPSITCYGLWMKVKNFSTSQTTCSFLHNTVSQSPQVCLLSTIFLSCQTAWYVVSWTCTS